LTDELGTIRRDGGRAALRFERSYAATPDEVWSAFTDPDSIRRWLFAEAVLEPREGGAFRLTWSESGDAGGSVLAWEPPHLLEVEWDDGRHRSVLRVEISRAERGASLVLDHRNVEPDAAAGMAAGWHAHLEALGELLGGRTVVSDRWQPRFDSVRPLYDAVAAGS
jgi:uncharacterized protein YndB with AHSA1/START domain